ncbi:MAG: prolipoprotein diacylglyceryl transferase [Bacteroidota bacterium]
MNALGYIIWNFDPELYSGTPTIRWYGLLFALGFLISQQILFYIYKNEAGPDLEKKKYAEKLVENLTVYMILATVIGARLGHVAFYQPEDYFTSFEGIIRIFNIREGGLASHGAAIGIILVLILFSKYKWNTKEGKLSKLFFIKYDRGYSFLQIIDRIVIVVALTGALIRFGNFTNSEIIGIPTGSDNGVVFARDVTEFLEYDPTGSGWVNKIYYEQNQDKEINENGYVPILIYIEFKKRNYDERQLRSYLDNSVNVKLAGVRSHIDEPTFHDLEYELVKLKDGTYMAKIATYGIARYPAQLYESATTFLLFVFLFYIWTRRKKETTPGLLFGIFLVILFTLRFFHEMIKENQVSFEDSMELNMGQWLSIPMVILGIVILIYITRKKKATEIPNE